jgi:hypothetical protein
MKSLLEKGNILKGNVEDRAITIFQYMKFNKAIALKLLVLISFLGILFQFLILFNCIPYDITWGGRLESDEQMYIFVSLGILD